MACTQWQWVRVPHPQLDEKYNLVMYPMNLGILISHLRMNSNYILTFYIKKVNSLKLHYLDNQLLIFKK